ncbi:MAG: hypothetical protein K6G09_04710, partial [Treponema sp.]|nr:hypothetical protein [Treponema sp.]
GNNCKIGVTGRKYEDGDHGSFYSADGIIVIRKGAVIPLSHLLSIFPLSSLSLNNSPSLSYISGIKFKYLPLFLLFL